MQLFRALLNFIFKCDGFEGRSECRLTDRNNKRFNFVGYEKLVRMIPVPASRLPVAAILATSCPCMWIFQSMWLNNVI